MERTNSWHNMFRKLLSRYERKSENYLGLVHLGCCIIVYRENDYDRLLVCTMPFLEEYMELKRALNNSYSYIGGNVEISNHVIQFILDKGIFKIIAYEIRGHYRSDMRYE